MDLESLFTACLALLIVVVGVGLGADSTVEDFQSSLKRPGACLCGLASQYVFMPFLAFIMARASGANEMTQIGIILTGCAPGGTTSNLLTLWSKGDVALSITMSFVSTAVAFFMLPLMVLIYIEALSDVSVVTPWIQIFVSCLLIALPTVVGLSVRRYRGSALGGSTL